MLVTGNWRQTQPINGHNVVYVKSETPAKTGDFYALDDKGELYLLEGDRDKKWLDDLEAERYKLEETKPG